MSARTGRVLAWGSFALGLVLCALSIAISVRNANIVQGSNAFGSDVGATSAASLMVLTFGGVGAIIAGRRPDNGLGWLFCADGLLISLQNFAGSYSYHGLASNPDSLPGAAWFALASDALWIPFVFMTTVFLFLLFPEGRLAGHGRRIAGRVAVVAVVAGFLDGFFEAKLYAHPEIASPMGVKLPESIYGSVAAASYLALLVVLVYAVVNLFRRLRRSTGEERLQFRWFGFSSALIVILFFPTALLETTALPPVVQLLGGLALFTLPIAVGMSILKYRLYEIDVVIKKTVVYAILAALIVIAGTLVLLIAGGLAVGPVSDNGALLVVAGVVLGFAIWPLRRIASRIADRIVRESPYEVLTSFADKIAQTYSTDDVLPRMAQVLATGTGADTATVWLRSADRYRVAAVWPTSAAAPDAIPIDATEVRHQGEVLGALSVEMPANDPMNPRKDALIRDFSAQAGLVLRNVRLIEDLRRSRRRIVAAQDERARKLERDIHDGAQQQLVALQVKLRLADATVDRDPEKTHELLSDLQQEANDALETLRDLARGIYPPLLADKGLPTALEAQARKSALPVEVRGKGRGDTHPRSSRPCTSAVSRPCKTSRSTRRRLE